MSKISSNLAIKGFIWKFFESASLQIIKFSIQVVLARILLPSEFGIIAILIVFIHISTVVVNGGLNTALIRKKSIDSIDYSTVFFTSLFLAFIMYIVLYFSAPIISVYFDEQLLTSIIRVLSITLFLGAFNSVQIAHVARKLNFEITFKSSLIAVIISGIISIYMALNDYGVWAIVTQQIVQQLISVILLLFMINWRPTLEFSISRFKSLFSFGWKVMAASLVGSFTESAYSLFIGKIYGSDFLGYYDRGHQFPATLVSNINISINSVLLPTFSSSQDSNADLKRICRRAISTNSFIVFPMMAGLIAVASPLVEVLLTEKWLFAVPFLQFEALFYATLPMMSAFGQIFRATGRSDINLKIEIAKTLITFMVLIIFFKFGIFFVVAMRAAISFIIVLISMGIIKKSIGYNFNEWINDIFPSLILSVLMAILVYSISLIEMSVFLLLFIQLLTGVIFYLLFSYIFKLKSFVYILDKILYYLRRRIT